MGRETTISVNKTWAINIGKYPYRFGKLVGAFYNLIEEANLSPERKLYWKHFITDIDKNTI